MRVCLPEPHLASPAAAAMDLPSSPMQTVHPVGRISAGSGLLPPNRASQLQVMPGFALEAQCSETVFKNKVTCPAMANILNYPAASQSRQPGPYKASALLSSLSLCWCRTQHSAGFVQVQ